MRLSFSVPACLGILILERGVALRCFLFMPACLGPLSVADVGVNCLLFPMLRSLMTSWKEACSGSNTYPPKTFHC